jgi:hypothetical protein
MPKEPRKTEVPEDEKPGVKEQQEAAQQQPEGPGGNAGARVVSLWPALRLSTGLRRNRLFSSAP